MNTSGAPSLCPLCSVAPRAGMRLRNGSRLRQCPSCRLAWWGWPDFDPENFYDCDYFQSADASRGYDDYASLEPGVRRTAQARLRRIDKLAPHRDDRRLFEIGCGTGVFLDEARRAGWSVRGVEVSAYAADQARRRGLDVCCGPVDRLALPGAAYDCIVMWDVIEHLPDPLGALRIAAAALRPSGLLALSTGDVESLAAGLCGNRWHLYNLPEHLFFFSLRSLRIAFSRSGFRGVQELREVNWVPLSYICERLGATAPGLSFLRARGRHAKWVLPATLFDVIGMYAVRTGDDATRPDSCKRRERQ